MDKRDIKRVLGRLEPDKEMEYRLAEKLNRGVPGRASYRTAASVAAALSSAPGSMPSCSARRRW